jgi:hypothetical protein
LGRHFFRDEVVKKSVAKYLNVKRETLYLAVRNFSIFICVALAIYILEKVM